MTAIAAALDMTAECGGAASLDRDHGMPPRGRQRRAMLVTESRAEVAEHIRHFQPLAGHEPRASGGHQVRHGRRHDMQALPADWPWRRPCWWRYADIETWCSRLR